MEEYLVQPRMYATRKGDYKKGDIINKKWKAISGKDSMKKNPEGLMGNIGNAMIVNKKTKKIKFKVEFGKNPKTHTSLYCVISAALALYRTICMINSPIVESDGAEGYKSPWSMKLIHAETGEVFGISEWKGAFGIWTRFHEVKEMPESFKKDIIEFLELMFSDKSPHPYDGCTAGQVA